MLKQGKGLIVQLLIAITWVLGVSRGQAETQVVFSSILNTAMVSSRDLSLPARGEFGSEIRMEFQGDTVALNYLYFEYTSTEAQLATVRIRREGELSETLGQKPLPLLFERRIILAETDSGGATAVIPLNGLRSEKRIVWTLSFEKPEIASLALADFPSKGLAKPGFWINPSSESNSRHPQAWRLETAGADTSGLHLRALVVGSVEPEVDARGSLVGTIDIDLSLAQLVSGAYLISLSTLTPGFARGALSLDEVLMQITTDAQDFPLLSIGDVLRLHTLPTIGFGPSAIGHLLQAVESKPFEDQVGPAFGLEEETEPKVVVATGGNVRTLKWGINSHPLPGAEPSVVHVPLVDSNGNQLFDDAGNPLFDIMVVFSIDHGIDFPEAFGFDAVYEPDLAHRGGLIKNSKFTDGVIVEHAPMEEPPVLNIATFSNSGPILPTSIHENESYHVVPTPADMSTVLKAPVELAPPNLDSMFDTNETLFVGDSEWHFTKLTWLLFQSTENQEIAVRVENGNAQIRAFQVREGGSVENEGQLQLVDLSKTPFVKEQFDRNSGLRFQAFGKVRYVFHLERSGTFPAVVSIVERVRCSDGEPCPESGMEWREEISIVVSGGLPMPQYRMGPEKTLVFDWAWPFQLVEAPNPGGPWVPVSTESPYSPKMKAGSMGFYRLEFSP